MLARSESVDNYETIICAEAELIFEDSEKQVMIYGLPEDTTLTVVLDEFESPIDCEEGIVLDKQTAEDLGIVVGDSVVINGIPTTVIQVSAQYACFVQYTNEETARNLLGEDVKGSVMVKLAEGVSSIPEVESMEGFDSLYYAATQKQSWENLNNSLTGAMYIVMFFAFAMGTGILIDFAYSSFAEQKNHYRMLLVLGFSKFEVGRIMLIESILQYVLALCVGIPAGREAGKVLLKNFSNATQQYPMNGTSWILPVVSITIFLVILLGNLSAMIQLRQMKLMDQS